MANATMTLIASQVLGSSAASVTFSSIPQTYTDLKLVTSVRDSISGVANGAIYMVFNSDTSSNYSSTWLYGWNSSTYSTDVSSATYFQIPYNGYGSSTSTANTFANIDIYIPNYTASSKKQISIFTASESNSTTNVELDFEAGLYQGTSAVSNLKLSAGQNFVANSSFYLYGIKNS
jgi:hypothetical protein